MNRKGRWYRYITNCTQANGRDINNMIERSRDITYATFMRNVPRDEVITALGTIGVDVNCPPLKDDYHVQFASSWYRGVRCYFITHSAIEFVFTAEGRTR